jgi:hypothetical protein
LKPRLFAVILLGLCFTLGACHKQPRATAPPSPPVPAPPSSTQPTPSPTPPPIPEPKPATPAPDYFQQGEVYFEKGYYAEAAESYENYLLKNPEEKNQDRVLFRLAISYALPGYPVHDPQKAMSLLKRLTASFPDSPYKPQAQFILELQTELEKLKAEVRERDERVRERDERIKRLTNELEKLKKIDMERRPSRPPN